MGLGTEICIRYQARISNYVTPHTKMKHTWFNLFCRRYFLAYGYLTRNLFVGLLFRVALFAGEWHCR